jgi:site-specific DNA-adenine methylase
MVSGPMFKWFGSKWMSSRLLPPPKHPTIIEPYAGGAGYSLRHSSKQVILWDDDPNLQVLWQWLIQAKESDIREIPINIPEGTDIRTLGLSVGQAMLMKHWQRTNSCGDTWTTSPWGSLPGQWTANTRARVASEVGSISHWKFQKPDWNTPATFFLDPPYLYNYRYRTGFPDFNHSKLALTVRTMPATSQVIVCEAVCPKTERVPDYLPFEYWADRITSRRKAENNHHSKELIYTKG